MQKAQLQWSGYKAAVTQRLLKQFKIKVDIETKGWVQHSVGSCPYAALQALSYPAQLSLAGANDSR